VEDETYFDLSLGLQKNMKSIFREKKKTLKKKHIFRKKTEKYFFYRILPKECL